MLFFDLFRKDPDIVEFSPGQTLCREGEVGEAMYVLLHGSAEIRSGSAVLERVGAGDLVGELGVLDGIPRVATVTALTDCAAAVIDQKRFHFLVKANPGFALEVMQAMARRLRQCDARLRDKMAT
jgi:CRP-like cAMP-binding protein